MRKSLCSALKKKRSLLGKAYAHEAVEHYQYAPRSARLEGGNECSGRKSRTAQIRFTSLLSTQVDFAFPGAIPESMAGKIDEQHILGSSTRRPSLQRLYDLRRCGCALLSDCLDPRRIERTSRLGNERCGNLGYLTRCSRQRPDDSIGIVADANANRDGHSSWLC